MVTKRNAELIVVKKLCLGEMIKEFAAKKGVSLRELARATGIAASTLNDLASGREPRKIAHVHSLSKYFGVSMETLLYGSDDRPPTLSEVMLDQVFSGWLKVTIEKAIPDKKKGKAE